MAGAAPEEGQAKLTRRSIESAKAGGEILVSRAIHLPAGAFFSI